MSAGKHLTNRTRTLPELKSLCEEDGPCWVWKGGVNSGGYPTIWHEGQQWYARRLVRFLTDGVKHDRKLFTTAVCQNPRCISPHCSRVTSRRDHLRDLHASGKFIATQIMQAARVAQTSAVSDEAVLALRAFEPDRSGSISEVARRHGLSFSYARRIALGLQEPGRNGQPTKVTPQAVAELRAALNTPKKQRTVVSLAQELGVDLGYAYKIREGKHRRLAGTHRNPFAGLMTGSARPQSRAANQPNQREAA